MTMWVLALLALSLTVSAAAPVAELLLGPGGNVVWRYAESLDEEPYKALSSEVSRLLSEK